jgi:hypothetical protein
MKQQQFCIADTLSYLRLGGSLATDYSHRVFFMVFLSLSGLTTELYLKIGHDHIFTFHDHLSSISTTIITRHYSWNSIIKEPKIHSLKEQMKYFSNLDFLLCTLSLIYFCLKHFLECWIFNKVFFKINFNLQVKLYTSLILWTNYEEFLMKLTKLWKFLSFW